MVLHRFTEDIRLSYEQQQKKKKKKNTKYYESSMFLPNKDSVVSLFSQQQEAKYEIWLHLTQALQKKKSFEYVDDGRRMTNNGPCLSY